LAWEDKVSAVNQEVRKAFKPEFVNRLDDIVVFSTLTSSDLGQIVEITVDRLQKRLSERRLELAVTPAARLWLAENGYDPIYGARPLRRLMQKESMTSWRKPSWVAPFMMETLFVSICSRTNPVWLWNPSAWTDTIESSGERHP